MTKSNLKKQLWCQFSDAITITSPKNATKITAQFFPICYTSDLFNVLSKQRYDFCGFKVLKFLVWFV